MHLLFRSEYVGISQRISPEHFRIQNTDKVQTHYEDCEIARSQNKYLAGTAIWKNAPEFETLYRRNTFRLYKTKQFRHTSDMGYFCVCFFLYSFNYMKPSSIILVINICIDK